MVISLISNMMLKAQVLPEGMNYQAVARNLRGEILANQPIALKVKLFSVANEKKEYYTENHDVVTSATGVFSLIIGKGKPEIGSYSAIPWSNENIWMEVAIKSKGQNDFAVISNSQLLAVPYAYHSMTADKLTGKESNNTSSGVPSNSWLLFGNRESNPVEDKLGTTDSVDLVMVTNNIERLRIYANGNIYIKRSLRIGADLNVDSSVYLNKLGGQTINYGPFTVDRESPTLLSGKLTVDKETDLNSSLNVDGITDLNSRLNVNNNSATKLTGTLRVDGVTDLNNALNVNNVSPTWLTGTLLVDKDASFNEKIKILSTHQTDTADGLEPSGSLQVGGGAYIKKNLFIGGIAKFGGPAAFGGAVSINDMTQTTSTSPDEITGALKVKGGVGVGRNLYVGEKFNVKGNVTVGVDKFNITASNGNTTIKGDVAVNTSANINKFKITASNGNTFIGGRLTTDSVTTLNDFLSVKSSRPATSSTSFESYVATFENTNNPNGILIKVPASTPSNANNFVTFLRNDNKVVGRIEGETTSELLENPDYKRELRALELAKTLGSINYVTGLVSVGIAAAEVIAAASSSTGCAGLGACVTAPIPSLIIVAGANFIVQSANAIAIAIGLDEAIAAKSNFVNAKNNEVGVTYQSGAGDYAEWLPKSNPSEVFLPGYIVGMKNGYISKDLKGASKLFVISTKPIVLGNMPITGEESRYEKVAFMGQVPVHVMGKVVAGDYILPSGLNNGLGIAVSPANMKIEDYANIVGVAWSSSTDGKNSLINVAIGLNDGDISKVVSDQNKEIVALKSKINETNSILAKLIPGFKEAAGLKDADLSNPSAPAHENHFQTPVTGANDIVYFEVTRDQILAMIDMAEKITIESGKSIETNAFWQQLKTDPGYKEVLIQQMQSKFKNAMHTHKDVNRAHLSGK